MKSKALTYKGFTLFLDKLRDKYKGTCYRLSPYPFTYTKDTFEEVAEEFINAVEDYYEDKMKELHRAISYYQAELESIQNLSTFVTEE